MRMRGWLIVCLAAGLLCLGAGRRSRRKFDITYRAFMRTAKDQSYRRRMWKLYKVTEPEAKRFARWKNWVRLTRVDCNREGRAIWIISGPPPSTRIDVPEDAKNEGALFHEMFHNTFHETPLQRNAKNHPWGEAFCDAFRYFQEVQHVKDSAWLREVNRRLETGWDVANVHDRPLAIVEHCQRDYRKFKAFWLERNAEPAAPLEEFFAGRKGGKKAQTAATPGSKADIRLRAMIDGESVLVITSRGIAWEHRAWARPFHITINGAQWDPTWDQNRTEILPLNLPKWEADSTVRIDKIAGRGRVAIAQQTADEIRILFHDPKAGTDFYDVHVFIARVADENE